MTNQGSAAGKFALTVTAAHALKEAFARLQPPVEQRAALAEAFARLQPSTEQLAAFVAVGERISRHVSERNQRC